MPEDITSQALPGGENINVAPADGTGAVSDTSEAKLAGVKDVLSQILGKSFPTDEAAAKSLKDTYAFVGGAGMKAQKLMNELKQKFNQDESGVLKFMENVVQNPNPLNIQNPVPQAPVSAPTADPAMFNKIAELQKQMEETQFFNEERPDLKEYRRAIAEIRDATGKPIREVVELPSIKTLIEKAKTSDEAERSRSVLHSNPQLGQVRDKLTEARDAIEKGQVTQAKSTVVSAVLDAYDLK